MDFEISVNYAKERVQFGRPIGSFQAIQHKAADMVTDVDGARFIMYRAAWSVEPRTRPDADLNVHMAKAWCSDATRRVVAHGQQIHGGIGFTKDYKIQLFFRRQKRSRAGMGRWRLPPRAGRRRAEGVIQVPRTGKVGTWEPGGSNGGAAQHRAASLLVQRWCFSATTIR